MNTSRGACSMNTFDDQPLGESPPITTLGTIEHFAGIGILAGADVEPARADLLGRQGQAIEEIRALLGTCPRAMTRNRDVLAILERLSL